MSIGGRYLCPNILVLVGPISVYPLFPVSYLFQALDQGTLPDRFTLGFLPTAGLLTKSASYILVRSWCVRCPWLQEQTKVATILAILFSLVQVQIQSLN